jgi:hypothetical protein
MRQLFENLQYQSQSPQRLHLPHTHLDPAQSLRLQRQRDLTSLLLTAARQGSF